MRALIVTEKCGAPVEQRDGGARLVQSLERGFGGRADIMQFSTGDDFGANRAKWAYRYPIAAQNRFSRRMANADFIADRVREVVSAYTHIIFVHASMQFGFDARSVPGVRTWTFPMFLTPSYAAAGEQVPESYTQMERRVLATTDRILTPSHWERMQLMNHFDVPPARVRVVPRGVNREHLTPKRRTLDEPPRFCSVGSVKRQKNTVGLVHLFHAIRERHPGARLRIIGPVQDREYATEVEHTIARLGQQDAIELVGYVPPEHLAASIADAHIHLSASACETFGRAIFETLASGLPNIAPKHCNAAAEYLEHSPYAFFYGTPEEALCAVDNVCADYGRFSSMALEVGELFDDGFLCQLLVAEVQESRIFAIADFDGTLYHKDNPARTRRCVEAFLRYSNRAVCSARPLPDLLGAMASIGVDAHFVMGWSGAVVTDGHGKTLWRVGFSPEEANELEARLPLVPTRLSDEGTIVQFSFRGHSAPGLVAGARAETYQGVTFVGRWECSKLRAAYRLLRHVDWRGRVRAFGDSRYDEELLRYFDGTLVRSDGLGGMGIRQAEEVIYECD